MGYIGNQTSNSYTSLDKQTITGDGGTGYTLDHAVANVNEIEVFVNNVRQEPSVAYTVSGTALTMTGNVAASDDFYVVFQGKAIQTTTHPAGNSLQAVNGTFTGDVDINGNDLILDADGDTKLYASTDDVVKINIAGSEMFRFDADGLKFNGDTASANALDDYEEGTFSPTATINANMTGTLTASDGYYTKIGNLVHIEIQFSGGSVSSTGNEPSFYFNLPFGAKVNTSRHVLNSYWSASRSNGWAVTRTASNNTELFVALPPELSTTSGSTTINVSGTYIAA